ncbi:multidrug and toxin extrusion protein 1-like isoform X1 [Nerophis lumbriciformis]|uniref:multidrug and toxin extrusion protein 1-like isoform X1 n=1 Tax=Nerophis lumbriciformis TaxID=546530 RepID=UPI002ADF342F|nr:multidrug and toxin extrusion protein 1-like [Nerophis lumbriciformis]
MEVAASDKWFCCSWLRHKVPRNLREELYHLLRMTGPILMTRILDYMLPFVVTMFCGRLTSEVMAGYGLATATVNITTAATGLGLERACDTLVAQTFGGKNLLRVGVIFQRGIIILLLFCLPCWGLLLNAQAILLLLGQDPEVTRIAQLYITAYLPAIPALFLHYLQVSYLQNQGIILPQMYTSAMANIASVVTNYVLIKVLHLGVYGSAAANTLSKIYICVFLFAYIRWKKLHKTTWGGWSVESLQGWGAFMKLAFPSTLMICFEWWIYEFGGFFAGMLGKKELAAQHVLISVANMVYMIPFGIQAAACARVGNALGAGDTAGALLTCKVSLSLTAAFAVVEGIALISAKSLIGFIFTSDPEITSRVSYVMNIYCFHQFFDGIVAVCIGIFMGTGKQMIAAVSNFIGFYGIGLTLCLTLMFVAKMNILGFWLGLFICVILQSTFYIFVIFRLNWKKITDEALKRARAKTNVELLNTSNQSADQPEDQDNSVDGYMQVTTKSPDGNPKSLYVIEKSVDHLSVSQLIIRRGMAIFIVVGLLVVGVCVHFLLPLPESPLWKANFTMEVLNATYSPLQTSVTLLDSS